MRTPSRKDLRPEDVTCLIDTREQAPLRIAPLRPQTATLVTGDYSVMGLDGVVAVERKSIPDLLACVGRERQRFDREVQRLLAYPSRLLVIEAPSLAYFERGDYLVSSRSQISPAAVFGSLLGWSASGLPVVFAGDHEAAGPIVAKFLYLVARRHWRVAQGLCAALEAAS